KYDATISTKLFRATRQASVLRVSSEYSWVIARKMGLPASGSTIGNSALTVSKKTLTASATDFSWMSSANARLVLRYIQRARPACLAARSVRRMVASARKAGLGTGMTQLLAF